MPRELTTKQRKLIEITLSNDKKLNKTKSKRALLKEAGYSAQTADNPGAVFDGKLIKAELMRRRVATIEKLEEIRSLTMMEIPKKIKNAPYNHLLNGMDTLTKNIQLLSGHATEHKAINIQISEVIADKNGIKPNDDAILEG